MSDPAVVAAQRAEEIDPFPELDAAGLGYVKRLLTEAAAREALKPIRDRHRPFDRPVRYMSKETERVCAHCLGPRKWPCPDALDSYTTGELER